MAVTRANAVINEDVALRAEFREPVTAALFDVNAITKVEIIDTDGLVNPALLTVATANVTRVTTGTYEVTVPKGTYPVGGVYFDKWYYKLTANGAELSVGPASTTVKEIGPKIRPRSDAVINTDVLLLAEFRNAVTGALFTPSGGVQKVEILDTDGEVLETVTAPNIITVAAGVYRVIAAGTNLDAVGTYKDKWYYTHDNVAATVTLTFAVQAAAAAATANLRAVKFIVADTSRTPTTAVEDVTLLVLDSSGNPYTTLSTDSSGVATVALPDDTYTVHSQKDNRVFDLNNYSIVITDPNFLTVPESQRLVFQLEGSATVPPFDTTAPVSASDLITAKITVANIDGSAIKRRVIFSNIAGVVMKGTTGVVGGGFTVMTDATGKASVKLVKGIDVGVSVEGYLGSRTITVPSTGDEFELLTTLSQANDGFDIYVPPTDLVREAI